MSEPRRVGCPACEEEVDRRDFLRTVGGATMAAAGASALAAIPARAAATQKTTAPAETAVKRLYDSLTAEQRKVLVLPWDDPRRTKVSPNWRIVEPGVADIFSKEQQEIVREIVRGVTSEDGYDRFQKQMQNDYGGFGRYTCAIFGEPGKGKFEWELTGRHVTLRADGDSVEGSAFGGPIVYGHAPEFNEKPGHPSNVFWYQAERANQVFNMLDGKQREQALVTRTPEETAVGLRPKDAKRPGICVCELSKDQQQLVAAVLSDILAPYRESDREGAMTHLKAGGGLSQLNIAFYQEGDIGDDSVWDIWRLEGPTVVCHFRGSPHIHAYIN
ncbi:MAG: DUF3500 domain-containing protein, partial [Planctomycetes bacterium]|nr:DUF3500 domain-containing protein [Planctomycetota bacterium]